MFDGDTSRTIPEVNTRMVRQFSVVLLLITSAFLFQLTSICLGFWGLILLVCIGSFGLVFPNRLRLTLIVLMCLTKPIGHFFSVLIFGAFFYLVFTPTALVMRVLGRDKLGLRPRGESSTYWKGHTGSHSKSSYFRQS